MTPPPSDRPVVIHASVDEPMGPDDYLLDDDVLDESGEPVEEKAELEPVSTRPCAYCGRPVPQRASAGRPFRYCRDNDDECLRAARAARMRQRLNPGLPGQVAQAFEVVDRLDKAMETLTEALHAELSPAGVQRQLDAVRAKAAADVAAAHVARDDARREAEQWQDEVARLRASLQQVKSEATQWVEQAKEAAESASRSAAAAVAEAEEQVAAARAATVAAEKSTVDARAHAEQLRREREEALRSLAAMQALHTEGLRERDAMRAARDKAIASRDEAVVALDEAVRARDAAQAEAAQSSVALASLRSESQAAIAAVRAEATELRERLTTVERTAAATISGLQAERDAARREAEQARRDAEAVRAQAHTSRQDAAAAQAHVAQLAEQVGQLAAALAALSPNGVAPSQPSADRRSRRR